METLRIEIIIPKVKKLLYDLADLNLIKINKENLKSEFAELLSKMRNTSDDAPSLEEITFEVEAVRKARN